MELSWPLRDDARKDKVAHVANGDLEAHREQQYSGERALTIAVQHHYSSLLRRKENTKDVLQN